MKKRVKKLINDGKYEEASAIAGRCLDDYELDEAEEIYNAIYDKVSDEKGRDSALAVFCLRRLADTAYEKGNYSLSLSMYNTVYEWYDSNNNLSSPDALLTMCSIADIYELHNRFDDEYELCRKAYSISLESDNEDEGITCMLINQLAGCCVSLGKYDEGISYYEHLLRIYQKDEEGYSDACFAMAENLRNMKQNEKAKEYAEKSLELRSVIYDDDHPEIKAARMLCEELI